jgi:sugar lactone lactonase YvrE
MKKAPGTKSSSTFQSVEIETLIKHAVPGLGEGPFWEEETQSLLFVDLTKGDVIRWHSKTDKTEKVSFGRYGLIFLIHPPRSDFSRPQSLCF